VPQVLRMKGLLDVAGSDCVHLFQAVYDLYDIAPGASWHQFLQQQQQQGAGRLSRLVLIGRGLDQAALQAAFEQCCEPS
jgi:G3E family GTPase